MKNGVRTSIDGSGRLVIPKVIRERANLHAGAILNIGYQDGRIEIEPATTPVRIVRKGPISVAVPEGRIETLAESTVQKVRDEIRRRRE
jgi:AbrB family looped-hinge helix DNA binding protein